MALAHERERTVRAWRTRPPMIRRRGLRAPAEGVAGAGGMPVGPRSGRPRRSMSPHPRSPTIPRSWSCRDRGGRLGAEVAGHHASAPDGDRRAACTGGEHGCGPNVAVCLRELRLLAAERAAGGIDRGKQSAVGGQIRRIGAAVIRRVEVARRPDGGSASAHRPPGEQDTHAPARAPRAKWSTKKWPQGRALLCP